MQITEKSKCACRLMENEHKKRQNVQKEKDEIGERIGPKITEKWKITENRQPWQHTAGTLNNQSKTNNLSFEFSKLG